MLRCSTLLFVLGAAPAVSQCNPPFNLGTPAPNNGQSGVMFDLEPTGGTPLRIDSFDIVMSTTTPSAYEVWVRQPLESHVGFTATTAGWTLLATSGLIAGLGNTVPVPLNLCLGYNLQTGGRTGFYITVSQAGGSSLRYTNGTAVGAVTASDSLLTVYDGNGGTYFSMTFSPRNFAGFIRYGFDSNLLDMNQAGPGVGNLSVSLGMLSAGAVRGWTIVSQDTSGGAGAGPLLGIRPDAVSWSLFSTMPMADGNPFHFPVPSPTGQFPNAPFVLPAGSVSHLAGLSMDFVCLLVDGNTSYAGHSNVVRMTFQ